LLLLKSPSVVVHRNDNFEGRLLLLPLLLRDVFSWRSSSKTPQPSPPTNSPSLRLRGEGRKMGIPTSWGRGKVSTF
jgi:hypothetical protein